MVDVLLVALGMMLMWALHSLLNQFHSFDGKMRTIFGQQAFEMDIVLTRMEFAVVRLEALMEASNASNASDDAPCAIAESASGADPIVSEFKSKTEKLKAKRIKLQEDSK